MNLRALVLAVLLSSAPAAAESDADKKVAAEALFAEGRQLMDAGQVEQACDKFERSDALDPAPGTLLNLGECYEKLGRTASAWATFRRAAAAANAKGQSSRAEFAEKRAQALEAKLSKLTITVPEAARVSGLVIAQNGRAVDAARWGSAVPVDPARIVVEAKAPGHRTWKKEITVGAGASETIEVPVLAEEGSAAAPPVDRVDAEPAEPASGSGTRTLGLVLAGVGVVGLGVGAFFGLQARSKYEDSKEHCLDSDPNQCEPEGIELRDDARASGNIATVAGLVGIAALGAGAVIYFSAPSGSERSARRLVIAPEVANRSGGVRVMAVW